MKRSQMLRILARRLSNREVDDIYEAALNEMEFVQENILERLPNQPWFLERELETGWSKDTKFITLPEDYNGLMTHGGVWFCEAVIRDEDLLTGTVEQNTELTGSLTLV